MKILILFNFTNFILNSTWSKTYKNKDILNNNKPINSTIRFDNSSESSDERYISDKSFTGFKSSFNKSFPTGKTLFEK